MQSKYMTPNEVCRELEIHYNTLYRWRLKRQGPPFFVSEGGRAKYPRAEFEQWKADRLTRFLTDERTDTVPL